MLATSNAKKLVICFVITWTEARPSYLSGSEENVMPNLPMLAVLARVGPIVIHDWISGAGQQDVDALVLLVNPLELEPDGGISG